jgi:biotin synthase-related radical SAM superfamily protein
MSLQSKLRQLYEPFAERLPCAVTHYRRVSTFPFAVWTEDGEANSFSADDRKQEQKIAGYIDYFTKVEFDETADLIQEILQEEGVAWTLSTVDYEEETNLIHFRWMWEVV